MASEYLYLVELTGYTDASTSSVYRYATLGYCSEPTDTPANAFWEGRVVDPGYITRQMFAEGQSGLRANPRSEVGYGAIVLRNTDGELDELFGAGAVSFRERQVRVLRVRDGAAYSTAELVLRASISQASLSQGEVTISVKDRLYELNSPHLTTVYAGNNALPAGVEGVADLAGKRKPLCLGKVFQVQAPCVNTSRQIYQLSVAAIQSATAYSGGVVVTAGADYTSQVDMETNAPTAGQVRVWPAGGMARYGGSPPDVLTWDVVADTTANSTGAQLLKRLALARGIDAGDISAADVTALDAATTAVLGVYIDDARTTLEVMDLVARSVGAYYGFDRTGVLRMARIGLATGPALVSLADWKVAKVTQLTTGEDVPTQTVRLKYARYHRTIQPAEAGGSLSDAAKADYGEPWRLASYVATISPNPHRRTQEAERETAFTAKADADAEAQRQGDITAAPLQTHLVEGLQLDDDTLLDMDLNSDIDMYWSRFGFGSEQGDLRKVIWLTAYYARAKCDLRVWGR